LTSGPTVGQFLAVVKSRMAGDERRVLRPTKRDGSKDNHF
jgi:hypothetical protein